MKPFDSFLAPQLYEFINYRESLGYETGRRSYRLRAFDRYLKQTAADWSSFQPAFFLRMRTDLNKQPASELTTMANFGLLESQVEFPNMSRILVDFPWSRVSILCAQLKYNRGRIQSLEAFS